MRVGYGLALVLALLGCSGQRPLPAPARFDRPNHVDFACVKTEDDGTVTVKTLGRCRNALDTTDDVALYALVTQSARGELAAVNLESKTVLDSRRDIPGYTFVPVGVLPSAVVVPPNHPTVTYVADFGSRDILVLTTASLVSPLYSDSKYTGALPPPEEQLVKLRIDTGNGSTPAAPTDMVLAPDENALLVSVPELGRVMWLPIQRCDGSQPDCHEGWIDEGRIASIDLRGSADRVVTTTPSTQAAPAYQELCGYTRPEPAPPTPLHVSNEALMAAPRPSALAIDAYCQGEADCHRRLLVADAALPLIHAVDLDAIEPGSQGSDALLAPLVVGVPTSDVVVTPRVPVSLDQNGAETQYVYAIDATDGSVLVAENGQVLNVGSPLTARPDRLETAGASTTALSAIKLAIMTPSFDPKQNADQYACGSDAKPTLPPPLPQQIPADTCLNADLQCIDAQHTAENPARLRGVFLSAALSNGTVSVFDIHDMELHSRVGKTACRVCPPTQAPFSGVPVLVRHQARLAVPFTSTTTTAAPIFVPASAPLVQVAGIQYQVRIDGTHGSPDAPTLDCVACGDDLVTVFPPPGQEVTSSGEDGGVAQDQGQVCTSSTPAFVCSAADPWSSGDERWSAVYEGGIPGTPTGATLPASDPNDKSSLRSVPLNVDLCAVGALGSENIEQLYLADGCQGEKPHGDQLVILESLATSPQAAMYDKLTRNASGDPLTGRALKLGQQQAQDCADAGKVLQDTPTLRLAFEIRRAFRDHVVIDSSALAHPVGKLSNYDDVLRCLGRDTVRVDVSTLKSLAVYGANAGFRHRVKTNPDGRCVLDPNGDPSLRGRAWLGCPFRNRTLAFQLHKGQREPLPGATFVVQNQTPATKLVLSTAVSSSSTILPVQLRYNAVDRRLYMVDISDRGLIRISLDPFPATVDSSNAFN